MNDVTITIVNPQGQPESWSAELWTGPPGSDGTRLAGGGTPFTLADLEAPGDRGSPLDKTTVLRAMREGDGENDLFLAVGLRLYALLDRNGVMQEWRARRTAAGASGLRTYFEVPSRLDEWPWELLAWWRNPAAPGLTEVAFRLPDYPIMRARPSLVAPEPWPGGIVRILLVSGQELLDPADSTAIASAELRIIREAFHKSNLSVIVDLFEAPATAPLLEDRIKDFAPHVLHFIGHGDLDAARQTDFQLRFKFDKGGWEWSANQIGQFVGRLPVKPRLVVLNSCHSSRPELGAAPVAVALLDAGVQAVIGAQAAVRIDHARTFSRAFYAALAKGQPVDRAMADTRNDLKNAMPGGDRRRLWALPVLTTNSPIDQVLQFTRVTGAVASSEEVREVFARRGRFVNRSADRWKLLSAFRPAGSADFAFRGVIVKSGTAQVGKSWLVKRCLRDFTDAGFVVRYASLVSSAAGKTSLDVLDEWRRSLQISPESGSPFADFDRALATAGKLPDAKAIVEVFEAFKNGLQSMRQGRPVVLVLERFRQQGRTWVSADGFRELLSRLLLPIRDGVEANLQGVHALLVARRHANLAGHNDDFEEFGLQQLSYRLDDEATRTLADGFRQLTVEEFESEQIGRYVDEFSDFTDDDDIRDVCNKFLRRAANGGSSWSPSTLQTLEPVYEAMGGTKGK